MANDRHKNPQIEGTPQRALQSDTVRALHDTEARMRSIVDTAVDGIFTINESGIIETVNKAAEKIFDYSADELIGKPVTILMPEPYKSEHPQYVQNYIETGEAKIIGKGREVVAKRKDGTIFPIDLAVSEFQIAGKRMFTGIVRDITVRKLAEQRLEAEHAVVRVLAEAARLEEATARVLGVLCRTLGWELGEFYEADKTGTALRRIFCWTSLEQTPELNAFLSIDTFAIDEGLPGTAFRRREPLWVEDAANETWVSRRAEAKNAGLCSSLAFPIIFGNETLAVIDFFSTSPRKRDEDVIRMLSSIGTQIGQFMYRRRIEERLDWLEEKLRHGEKLMVMGMLASEIAHEIGTPLNIIAGRIELLSAREKTDEEFRHNFHVIHQQIDRISKILREHLELTRKKTGRMENVDINRLIQSLLAFLRVRMKKTKLDVNVSIPQGLAVIGDEDQLQQVFLNLIINALEAMGGSGRLRFAAETLRDEGVPFVEISIHDTGPGISQADINRIFDPFFSTKKGSGGTGLGLAIVQDIVKRHGGRIRVESVMEEGTVFRIILPAPPAA